MTREEIAKSVVSKLLKEKSAEHVKEITASNDAGSYIEDLDLWTGKNLEEGSPKKDTDLFGHAEDTEDKAQLPKKVENEPKGDSESDESKDLNQGYSVDKGDMYTGSGDGPELGNRG